MHIGYFFMLFITFFKLLLHSFTATRLNLFNHVLVLFCAKFAYILAIKYPVFRWKLCKDCVWESVKKTQVVCIQRSLATNSRLPKCHTWHTCEACRMLKGHDNWSTTGQKVQSDRVVSSRLISLARLSRQNALFCKKMTFHIPHVLYYKYPYTHKM